MNTLCSNTIALATRRDFLRRSACGFGWLAFSALAAAQSSSGYTSPLAIKPTHFAPKAKRVIFLFMSGGPSHVDTFDWKPELAKQRGNAPRKSGLLAPVFSFRPHGRSGLMISEIFPQLARHADSLCLLNGSRTNTSDHQQAVVAMHTGNERFVRPSLGAWVTYGLGTINQELPGFVTIDPVSDLGGAQNYGSAFLPAVYQGTRLGSGAGGIPNLANRHLDARDQRRQVDFIQQLNRGLRQRDPQNPEFDGVAESMELAYKMQTSVPTVFDLAGESQAILDRYGIGGASDRFGRQCLLARRQAERGVRFIQVTHSGWDHHNNLREGLRRNAEAIDRPIAALLDDLKERGLLKDTLVVWGGEFGRSPHDDKGDGNGRGHNGAGFTMWMAGGGVKGGLRYGATDETGKEAVAGKMGTHDLHATILHLLGLDHERLTYRYAGRDFRLTDVAGDVATGIIA
jgi:hypothetical protein